MKQIRQEISLVRKLGIVSEGEVFGLEEVLENAVVNENGTINYLGTKRECGIACISETGSVYKISRQDFLRRIQMDEKLRVHFEKYSEKKNQLLEEKKIKMGENFLSQAPNGKVS